MYATEGGVEGACNMYAGLGCLPPTYYYAHNNRKGPNLQLSVFEEINPTFTANYRGPEHAPADEGCVRSP